MNQEINYIQKTDSFINSSGIPTGDTRMNKFVVGSNVDVALQDGRPTVNGARIDHLTPDDFYKDRDGNEYIDFEQEFASLNVAANDLATATPAKTYTAADFPDMNNRTIDLTGLSDSGFLLVNIDAEVLTMNTPLQIINPNDQVVVFNVINSSSALNVQSPIKYNDRSNHETEDFSDANISWNFGNEMTDLTISAPFQGTILAPNATIHITQNQDGTIIGTNVILDAATNRWDPNEIFISDNGTGGTDTTSTSDSSDTTTSSDSTGTTATTSDSSDTSTTSDSTDTTTTSSDGTDTTTTTSSDSTDTTTSSDSTDTTTTSSDSTDTTTTSDSTDTTTTSDSSDTTRTISDSTDTTTTSDSSDTTRTISDSTDTADTTFITSDSRHASVSFPRTSSDNKTNVNLTNKTSDDHLNKSKKVLPKTGSQSNNWITVAGVILLVIGLRITFMSHKKSKR